jgi:hypothetical protein
MNKKGSEMDFDIKSAKGKQLSKLGIFFGVKRKFLEIFRDGAYRKRILKHIKDNS